MKIYHRQSSKERGHFSNHFTLHPVCELGFGAEILRIVQGRKTIEIPYDQLSAEIIERYMHKSYGAGIGGCIKQTLVILKSQEAKFRFDLSRQFPDFRNSRQILIHIQEKIDTTISKESLKMFKRKENFQLVIAVALALIVIGFSMVSKHGI